MARHTFLAAALVLSLGLCLSGAGASRLGVPQTLTTPSPCSECMFAVRVLDDLLCDPEATQWLINFMDKKVCPAVGDSIKCHNVAEGLIPVLVQWFRAASTPLAVCTAAGACGHAAAQSLLQGAPLLTHKYTQPRLQVRDGADCAVCSFVVSRVQTMLNNTDAVQKLNETAQQVCQSLPADLAAVCTGLVNQYEPLIMQFLTSTTPVELCQLLGMCMAGLVQRTAHMKPLLATSPEALLALQRVAARMEPSAAPAGRGSVGPLGDTCDMCKMAVIEAHSLISNPSVQADLVNYTKALCDSFPSFTDACKQYVDEYAPLVFSLLQQYLVPDQLCAEMGLCGQSHMQSEQAQGAAKGMGLVATLLGRLAAWQQGMQAQFNGA